MTDYVGKFKHGDLAKVDNRVVTVLGGVQAGDKIFYRVRHMKEGIVCWYLDVELSGPVGASRTDSVYSCTGHHMMTL